MQVNLRLEAKQDRTTGKWYVLLELPGQIVDPIARTRPIFDSPDDALTDIGRAIKKLVQQTQ